MPVMNNRIITLIYNKFNISIDNNEFAGISRRI